MHGISEIFICSKRRRRHTRRGSWLKKFYNTMEFVSNALCLSSHEAYSSKNPSREHSKWLIAAAERVFIVAYRLVVLMLCELTIALKHDQYRPPLAKLLKASQISSSQWHLLWYHVKTNASPKLPMLHHMVYLQNIGKQISQGKNLLL